MVGGGDGNIASALPDQIVMPRQVLYTLYGKADDGAWRSPVAHRSGGPVVGGSNPLAPTKLFRHVTARCVTMPAFFAAVTGGLYIDNSAGSLVNLHVHRLEGWGAQ